MKEILDYPKLESIEPMSPAEITQPKMNLNIQENEITIDKPLSTSLSKLGTIYIGTYKGKRAAIRRLTLPRLNNYITEKLHGDMSFLSGIICPHYISPLGISIRDQTIDIVSNYFPVGSLHHVLHSSISSITYKQKLNISREISFALKIIHDFDITHGHLTTYNILLDFSWSVYITDIGLDHLKKFCGLTNNYINKSAWSSPELLQDNNKFVTKKNKSDDVYSFGIILWEIMTGEEPFPNIPLRQISQMVCEGYRPGIPIGLNMDICELLKSCWNREPLNRPSSGLIHNTLCNIIANDEGTESFYSAVG
jgi:serine/threonine protein kinase